ncbi:MAG: exodeoxyribonuclease III [Rhodospirillales bacterium]|nr:exodeoxyribonuclease III [Rhodospirillales bacterium]
MTLTVVTWNVNSIRLRTEQLARLSAELRPDVICLQETKVTDALFPRDAMVALGYRHVAAHGMKGYNGVAVLSRLPIEAIGTPHWCGRQDCRHLVVTIAGIEIHCVYVPSGGDVPDPAANPKFAHKLQFLRELTDWYARTCDPARPLVLVGDLNVAPLESDVWSHRQLLKVVSHTPVEVEALGALAASLDWVDAVRHFVPAPQRLYTWWSYRAADWAKSDRGRRLDHVWVTPALKGRLIAARVVREARNWQPPSDHVPVAVTLAMPKTQVTSR